ncbi:MAG: DUF6653 family protein [Pseudomonadota bacterium]
MSYAAAIARIFRLDDEGWRRHANPWSGWTRVASGPLLFAAVWSAHGIGWWSLVPIAAVTLWTWLNPRLFAPPAHYEAWVSRAVLGERAWIALPRDRIPTRHRRGPHVLNALGAPLLAPLAVGVALQDLTLALAAFGGVVLLKFWFLDRMVLLWDDVRADGDAFPGPAP